LAKRLRRIVSRSVSGRVPRSRAALDADGGPRGDRGLPPRLQSTPSPQPTRLR
jgi:hypothetical protein